MLRHLRHHQRRSYAKYTGRLLPSTSTTSPPLISISPPSTRRDPYGYPLPRNDLICKSLNLLLSPPSPSPPSLLPLSEYLHTLSSPLSPSEASLILKPLPPSLALSLFHFLPSLPSFRHTTFTFNRILHILHKSTLPQKGTLVSSILSDMDKACVRGTISTINILIGVFGEEGGDVVALERCLGYVKKWDLVMNSYTYKCLLTAYCRLGDSGKGFMVYREMRRRACKLDVIAYNFFLDALGKDQKVAFLSFN